MKYKVGDKVRIKSLDWYEENKDEYGYIDYGSYMFFPCMSKFCGKTFEIAEVYSNCYHVKELYAKTLDWTDEMIDCLVEEETKFGTTSNPIEIKSNANCLTRERVDALAVKIDKELPYYNQNVWELPDGYRFIDENGNEILTSKIILEKKEVTYPKTYEECCKVMSIDSTINHTIGTHFRYRDTIEHFIKLLICRDAYWKLYGEEIGLGKPWEPDYNEESYEQGSPIKYVIYYTGTNIIKGRKCTPSYILSFPSEEMRDAFYGNFKEEIEICKELF